MDIPLVPFGTNGNDDRVTDSREAGGDGGGEAREGRGREAGGGREGEAGGDEGREAGGGREGEAGGDGEGEAGNSQVKAGNGDSVVCEMPDAATETDGLLAGQTNGCNGETVPSNHAAENQRDQERTNTPRESSMYRIKRELNEVVLESKSAKCKIRLWMIILFIISLITTVIIISLAVCSAIHKDPDEIYDPLLFKVPVYFNGSFQLPNLVFTDELHTLSSNESQTLATGFQEKLADLYRSSPALGRYFSEAEINAFRNGSVMADYQLKFLMPEEGQDQLRNFTLSREMVYNVFRQFLYDQEPNESEPMYIDPVSLKMFVRH